MTNLFGIFFVAILMLFLFDAWRAGVELAVLWLTAFVSIGSGFVPRWLARSLQNDVPAPSAIQDGEHLVVILLGDGTVKEPVTDKCVPTWLAHSRISTAAQLYLAVKSRGGACMIIVTADDSSEKQTPSVYVTNLAALGVAGDDVRLETRGRNTYEQAKRVKEMLQAMTSDRLMVVTSGLHVKRATRYFRNVGLQATPIASDSVAAQITFFPAAYNFAITDIACHQYIGLARMHLYNALGWNR